jgi:hypothetical protein
MKTGTNLLKSDTQLLRFGQKNWRNDRPTEICAIVETTAMNPVLKNWREISYFNRLNFSALKMNAIQYDHDELTDFLRWEERRPENSIGQMPYDASLRRRALRTKI